MTDTPNGERKDERDQRELAVWAHDARCACEGPDVIVGRCESYKRIATIAADLDAARLEISKLNGWVEALAQKGACDWSVVSKNVIENLKAQLAAAQDRERRLREALKNIMKHQKIVAGDSTASLSTTYRIARAALASDGEEG
jgi:hypothetical protein